MSTTPPPFTATRTRHDGRATITIAADDARTLYDNRLSGPTADMAAVVIVGTMHGTQHPALVGARRHAHAAEAMLDDLRDQGYGDLHIVPVVDA